jgi:hypothetical protein
MGRVAVKKNVKLDIKKFTRTMSKEQFMYELCENLEGDYIEYCPNKFGLEAKYLNKSGTCDNEGKEEQCRDCIQTAIEGVSFRL